MVDQIEQGDRDPEYAVIGERIGPVVNKIQGGDKKVHRFLRTGDTFKLFDNIKTVSAISDAFRA